MIKKQTSPGKRIFFKKTIGDITIATNLDDRIRTSGKFSVRIRIQYQGSKKFYTTHSEMSPEEYSDFLKGKWHDRSAAENVIEKFNLYYNTVKMLNDKDAFSFETLKSLTGKDKKNTLQDLIQNKINRMHKQSTKRIYGDLLAAVNKYTKNKPINLYHVNQTWCAKFMAHLADKGNGPTTVSMRMRSLKHILQKAEEESLIKKNPAMGLEIPHWKTRERLVDDKVLKHLLNVPEKQTEYNDFYWLQLWRAIYYGNGINLTDLLHLKWENISNNMIIYQRRKIAKPITVKIYITPELNSCINILAQKTKTGRKYIIPLLDDYEEESKAERRRLDQICRNVINAIHRIADDFKPDKNITTYSARHTFATKILRAGAPIEYISFAMGHSSINTTRNHYLEGYSDEQIKKFSSLL